MKGAIALVTGANGGLDTYDLCERSVADGRGARPPFFTSST